MKSVALNAAPRTQVRRGPVKKLRAAGKIPAVIYGGHTQPQSLEINIKDLESLLVHSASENILIDLNVAGDQRPKRLALMQEVQHHPLSRKVLHVDLHEVAENEKVTITVPVESTGEPVGVKVDGGVLEHVLFKVKVRALPKDLPEIIVVDVSNLGLGKAIHIGDIVPPAGVEVLGDKKIVVLSVAHAKTDEEAAAEEAVATAAPGELVVLKEKKEEGAEGAAAAPAGDKKAAAPAAKAPAPKAPAGDKKK